MSNNIKNENKNRSYNVFIIILFLFILLGGLILLSYLFRPVTNSRKNICGFYAEKKDTLDMVYIGGSACYAYWEPLSAWNDYGFTSYNFATDALQPQSIKYVLKEIQKTQSPEIYLIDLRPFQYGDAFNEEENVVNMERGAPFRNVSDNMKYSWNRADLIYKGAPSQEPKWTYYFDLSKYHSNLFSILKKENWQYIFNSKRLYTKGFKCYEEANLVPYEDTRNVTEKLQLEEPLDSMFTELLEYCKEEDLQVLFIVHAYFNTSGDQQKYNYMRQRIEEYGQDYLNVNDYFFEIGLDLERDFHDTNHVNLLGADKYTNFLANYLDEKYDLPDKRDDSNYEQWNRDYLFWKEEMDIIRENMQNGKED